MMFSSKTCSHVLSPSSTRFLCRVDCHNALLCDSLEVQLMWPAPVAPPPPAPPAPTPEELAAKQKEEVRKPFPAWVCTCRILNRE